MVGFLSVLAITQTLYDYIFGAGTVPHCPILDTALQRNVISTEDGTYNQCKGPDI